MLGENKLKLRHDNLKINIIYLLLLISNIILLTGLIYYYLHKDIYIGLNAIDNIFTIISTIIILGFVTTRLPQFRKMGNSSLYEIGYLIIIGILSIMVSYFNSSTHTQSLFSPYIEMFKILSVSLILVIIATKTKPFKDILHRKFTRKNQFICFGVFAILGILASQSHIYINGTPANIRCLVVMISGLFGGPFVGVPVGIISGAYRLTLGGHTALPCAISTILSGIIGSLIFIWNDKKFPRTIPAITLMFLYVGFEMLLIVVISPPNISFPSIRHMYPVMLFGSVVGMILFSMILKEEKMDMKKPMTYEEMKIKEFETELEVYDDRIEELEAEIEQLKKEKKS
jgi:two-component system LytT family sensor kinase